LGFVLSISLGHGGGVLGKRPSKKTTKREEGHCCRYRTAVSAFFSAAHNLKNYKGACENLHGHNWKVEIVVGANRLNENQMVMDFADMKQILSDVLSALDHKYLNELPEFENKNITSEFIAEYIASKVKQKLPKSISLCEVSIWESDNSRTTFSP
jgi:6-pyruvoyltetrahydropterin/6-carboxytetrahydropterin synthase